MILIPLITVIVILISFGMAAFREHGRRIKDMGLFDKLKRNCWAVLMLVLVGSLTGCTYHPPEGYRKEHHTYDDMVEYAKSIDSQATVAEEYTVMKDDNRAYRIWPAYINGVECNVASISKEIYNDGFLGGEFSRTFYRCDTDYDFLIVNDVLKKHPVLGTVNDSISNRFHTNDLICTTVNYDAISNDQFNELWDEYMEMNSELKQFPLHKTYMVELIVSENTFYLTTPTEDEYQKVYGSMVDAGLFK